MRDLKIKIEAECSHCHNSYSATDVFPIQVAEEIATWNYEKKCYVCNKCGESLNNDIL